MSLSRPSWRGVVDIAPSVNTSDMHARLPFYRINLAIGQGRHCHLFALEGNLEFAFGIKLGSSLSSVVSLSRVPN